MLNHVAMQGRLTKDPELRFTQSERAVCTIRIACDRDFANKDGGRDADFMDCVAWNSTAEFLSSHFAKGDQIIVTGRLQNRSWDDREGNKHQATEIIVDRVYFCGSKKSSGFNDLDDLSGTPFDEGELPL